VVGVLLCVPVVPAAMARGPMDDVRRHVEEAFQTLDEGDPGGLSAAQRRALRRAADKIFDWPDMARSALGPHWAHTTRPERERFARLLSQLFERMYVAMLERGGTASIEDAMVYVGETVRGDQAIVRLRWKRPIRDIAVDCAMRRTSGGWRVHDVALDGFSVIENYRAQFDRVIQRSSYQELVSRLEAKLQEPASPSEAPRGPAEERRVAASPVPFLIESP
jgi:phospholipid transport system substrate-binding protein